MASGLHVLGIVLAGGQGKRLMPLTADRAKPAVPFGGSYRLVDFVLSNFVNGELWGRVTDVPWGVVFPSGGPLPRHPSQLYEAFLEGLVIFVVMNVLARRKRPDGFMLGALLIMYGVFRTAVEFVREPDAQLGFILGPFSMGQLLSLPMIGIGVWLMWRAHRAGVTAESA